MISVILCGGSGARLWPLSRAHYPKQFLNLNSDMSLLRETVNRVRDLSDKFYFVANEEHRFMVAEQQRLADVKGTVLLEPVARNTAPAIAIAALQAVTDGCGDEAMVVLPSDHLITDGAAFRGYLKSAEKFAKEGLVVTLGVQPTRAETGYGYIHCTVEVDEASGARSVQQFTEKPIAADAEAYLGSGEFLWNSGIFIVTPNRYLYLLQKFAVEVFVSALESFKHKAADLDFVRVSKTHFKKSPSISIDYALMEPLCESSESVVVIPFELSWSDLGSWSSLWDLVSKDPANNAVVGDVLAQDVTNSYLHSSDRLVAAVGVDNLVIVESSDAVLVADKNDVQNVKHIVKRLEMEGRSEYVHHRAVYRPWGKYDLIGTGDGYQVKQITVSPGAALSLQKHECRAEHWVVVKGCAEVVQGSETYTVRQNESTYIPIGEVHSLRNPTEENLIIIEVQSGEYLGEDDIVRYKDQYGRIESV
ncbi:mannose-1-phosphate guanylyltransferase/mannose-6-phosphate isomerase [Neptuniibacter sp. QD37_6]|uniref:mannose-1-phosphate guanylyltransferase/mannose-6-phosphate isomerase n=1 Tax=Neptuniibacter sp. QD37_6 TaxID=3398210 RepID=UPI0039F44B1C